MYKCKINENKDLHLSQYMGKLQYNRKTKQTVFYLKLYNIMIERELET